MAGLGTRDAGPPDEHSRGNRPRAALVLVSLSTLLVQITFVTPLITGVRTAAALHAGIGTQAWLLSAMSLGMAAALLVAGVVADDVGHRSIFIAGLCLVAVGAAVASLSDDVGWFIAARVSQGVGAGAVMACALGLIAHVVAAGPQRSRAMAVWGASVGAGTGIGAVMSLLVDQADSWRLSYVVTSTLAAALAVAARLVLNPPDARGHRRVDAAGAVLLAAGTSCLLAGMVQSRGGWLEVPVIVLFAVALALLAGFVAVERRARLPLIDLTLFARPGFLAGVLGAFVVGAVVIGIASYLPTVVQLGLRTGLSHAVWSIVVWSGASTVSALATRALHRLEGRWMLVGGLIVCALGLLLLAQMRTDGSSGRLIPGLIVLGLGYGAANSALAREAVAHVHRTQAAMGSGANNTFRYIGAATGVTVIVLVVGHTPPIDTASGLVTGWNHVTVGAAGLSLIGGMLVGAIRHRG